MSLFQVDELQNHILVGVFSKKSNITAHFSLRF